MITLEMIESMKLAISTGTNIFFRDTNNNFHKITSIHNMPAYEGDPEPEPSAILEDGGWCALQGNNETDYFVANPFFKVSK